MNIKVNKITDERLLHLSNSYTTGKPSKMSLAQCYRARHSNLRTQLFTVEFEDIPLFVASQLVRSKVGVEWWQKSKRTDRGGMDFNDICRNLAFGIRTEHVTHENEPLSSRAEEYGKWADAVETLPEHFDRYAPTSLMGLMNAEAIINMSRKRLCAKASKETREIWQKVCEAIKEVDPDLYPHLVPPCVAKNLCSEAKSCGYIKTIKGIEARKNYKDLFR